MWGQVYGDRKAKEVELNKQGECLNNNMEVQIKDNKIYAPLKDKWLVVKPEEKVRQRYICRLVDSYGTNKPKR